MKAILGADDLTTPVAAVGLAGLKILRARAERGRTRLQRGVDDQLGVLSEVGQSGATRTKGSGSVRGGVTRD